MDGDFTTSAADVLSTCLFFVIPALASTALYSAVGYTLLTKKHNRGRNQVLTVSLLFSCLFWLLLAALSLFAKYYYFIFAEVGQKLLICITGTQLWLYDCENQTVYSSSLPDLPAVFSPFFSTFSAFMNSFCLLVVVKKFWEPVKQVWGCIKRGK